MKLVQFLFGEIDEENFIDILLCLLYFIASFSATCFFFDSHQVKLFGYSIHFPVGVLFFPATYVLSNIIQDRKSRSYANSVIVSVFLSNTLLVGMSVLIAYLGDRTDFWTVFNELPVIMGSGVIFIGVSSVVNTFIFEYTKALRKKSAVGVFISFFSSITAAELLISSMSMPLLFYKQGLRGSVILTILLVASYKIIFNLISTGGYVLFARQSSVLYRGENRGIGHISEQIISEQITDPL